MTSTGNIRISQICQGSSERIRDNDMWHSVFEFDTRHCRTPPAPPPPPPPSRAPLYIVALSWSDVYISVTTHCYLSYKWRLTLSIIQSDLGQFVFFQIISLVVEFPVKLLFFRAFDLHITSTILFVEQGAFQCHPIGFILALILKQSCNVVTSSSDIFKLNIGERCLGLESNLI